MQVGGKVGSGAEDDEEEDDDEESGGEEEHPAVRGGRSRYTFIFLQWRFSSLQLSHLYTFPLSLSQFSLPTFTFPFSA